MNATSRRRQTRQTRHSKPADAPPACRAPNSKYQPNAVIAAIVASKGMISAAARILGCHRTTITEMAKREPTVQQALEDENALALDMSEIALFQAIGRGDVTAIKFHLKCKGRARGYVEKSDVVLSGGVTLEDIITRSMELDKQEAGKK